MGDVRVPLEAVSAALRERNLLVEAVGASDGVLTGVCQDSRAVEPGDLFVAWKGTAVDAHQFVASAVESGAVAAVVERVLDVDLPQLVVRDGRAGAAVAADVVMGSPWREMFMAAVTGTNGKTTTAFLARHLLGGDRSSAAVGTLGVVDADGVRPGTGGLTTPGPAQVAEWLRELARDGVEAVVMEASSHALDQRRLDGVRYDVGVFTNLSQDHLDYHADTDSYLAAKARLVELVAEDGVLAVNADDPAWNGLDAQGRRVRTFSVEGDADVRAEDLTPSASGTRFALAMDGTRNEVDLPLVGRFNVENALAAAVIAAAAGQGPEAIAAGLTTAPQVAGRLERVHAGASTVLIDFAHTPDALENVLTTLRPLVPGRLIVVFGAGGDRDPTKRRPMAETVARHADVIVLTSDNPRGEDPEAILDDLAEGLRGVEHVREADRVRAIGLALETARPGDTVLLAGKGHETYQIVGDRTLELDERTVVADWFAHGRNA